MSASAIDQFRDGLRGRLILPGDAEYETARRGRGGIAHAKHPDLIVLCGGTDDVIRAIDFARSSSLAVAVRSGGHDTLAASTCDGGLVIDLSPMNDIDIDPASGVARVGGGALAGELFAAAAERRLVPVLGLSPRVGVSGLTLGGGLGFHMGRLGAACDHLLEADVVTADGRTVRASKTEHPDLFWAIRGGGGNFGVAITLSLQLHPAPRQVLSGRIEFETDVGRFLRFYREFLNDMPDDLTAEAGVTPGRRSRVWVHVFWYGDIEAGRTVLRPLERYATPVSNTIAAATDENRDHPEAAALQNAFFHRGSFAGLRDEVIDMIAELAAGDAPAGCGLGFGHYMHGVICRGAPEATPLIRHAGHMTYHIDATWGSEERGEFQLAWAQRWAEAMRPVSAHETYISYLADDSEDAIRNAYGQHYRRLQSVKRRYDPTNFFNGNRNVRPEILTDSHLGT